MDDLPKAQIALIATFLGWCLGQGAELIRNYVKDRKVKRAILTELSDTLVKIRRDASLCEKTIYAIKNGMNGVGVYPHETVLPVYETSYSGACLLFSEGQREGINQAYGHIRSVNKRLSVDSDKEIVVKVFEIYIDCIWAAEVIEYLFAHNGHKQLKDDQEKIKEINDNFEYLWHLTK